MSPDRTVDSDHPLTIIVLGASGDLARKKIFPALFALYCQGFLPTDFLVIGFARSDLDEDAFRNAITENLTCRYAPGESCAERMREFLGRCHYHQGHYDDTDSYLDLYQHMVDLEMDAACNRVFFMAIPPSVFKAAGEAIGSSGLVSCREADVPWTRAVIEKPFGHDRASSDALTEDLAAVFTEGQTFRIDHYLGKEVIQNLMVLRFANLIFEPLWSHTYIQRVDILWSEDLDVAGRGGYFDDYGIIRDVMQNHLLQILALVAMEQPVAFTPQAIRNEKVSVLQAITPPSLDDVVLGQYSAATHHGRHHRGYVDDDSVPDDSLTATFAAVRLEVNRARWQGVPFTMTAGKGLQSKRTDIRIVFREPDHTLFHELMPEGLPANELRIRVQPNEGIDLKLRTKVPGLAMRVGTTELDLHYSTSFNEDIPEAYECLLLDVIRGDKSLFIRSDELAASWDVFTPLLHQIDDERIVPAPYPFGSAGPDIAKLVGN